MHAVDREAFGSAEVRLRFVVTSSLGAQISQRGATECQTWNEGIQLAAVIWLRLRRAEVYGLWSMVCGLFLML